MCWLRRECFRFYIVFTLGCAPLFSSHCSINLANSALIFAANSDSISYISQYTYLRIREWVLALINAIKPDSICFSFGTAVAGKSELLLQRCKLNQAPIHHSPSPQRHQRIVRKIIKGSGHRPAFFYQRDAFKVARQAVPVGAVVAREAF